MESAIKTLKKKKNTTLPTTHNSQYQQDNASCQPAAGAGAAERASSATQAQSGQSRIKKHNDSREEKCCPIRTLAPSASHTGQGS